MKAYIEYALTRFIDQYQIRGFSGDNYSPEVLKATKFISRNLSIQLKAADIAACLFISESKLTKEFKAETGMTIGKYTDALIFSRAEFLLSKTNHSIKSISNELGFCDQFYFARQDITLKSRLIVRDSVANLNGSSEPSRFCCF